MSCETNPPIAAHPNGTPFLWSVMIPCYQARPDYLSETLRSLLAQDQGPAAMQIMLVDDGSPNGPPADLIKKLAGDRITIHREEKNRGLAGIMNRCIELAQGRWIHLLHQDDVIKPGFYEKLKAGTESPAQPGLLYCRYALMDERSEERRLSLPDADHAGCLPEALPYLASAQRIQMPSVVVRRAAYEAVGGFRADLCFTLDWEMWCRIARQFPIWYEPTVLAGYRVHSGAATSRLVLAGRDIEDTRKCIRIISGYVTDPRRRVAVRQAASRRTAMFALKNAADLLRAGEPRAAWRQIIGALKCDFSLKVLKETLKLLPAALGLIPRGPAA